MDKIKMINNARNTVKSLVNNTSNFVQNNKVEITGVIISGGAGAIKGALKDTGLHFSKELAREATLKEIKKEALKGAKNGVIVEILGNSAVQVVLNPDEKLNETKIGKAINNEIQYATKCVNTGVDRVADTLIKLVGGGSK